MQTAATLLLGRHNRTDMTCGAAASQFGHVMAALWIAA